MASRKTNPDESPGRSKPMQGSGGAPAARVAVLMGEDELARDAATLRDLDTGEQSEVKLTALEDALAPYR